MGRKSSEWFVQYLELFSKIVKVWEFLEDPSWNGSWTYKARLEWYFGKEVAIVLSSVQKWQQDCVFIFGELFNTHTDCFVLGHELGLRFCKICYSEMRAAIIFGLLVASRFALKRITLQSLRRDECCPYSKFFGFDDRMDWGREDATGDAWN